MPKTPHSSLNLSNISNQMVYSGNQLIDGQYKQSGSRCRKTEGRRERESDKATSRPVRNLSSCLLLQLPTTFLAIFSPGPSILISVPRLKLTCKVLRA